MPPAQQGARQAQPMPHPSKSHSPRFNGKAKNLLPFIKDFTYYADLAELTADERIKQIGRYARRRDQELWELLPQFTGTNFEAYLNAIKLQIGRAHV